MVKKVISRFFLFGLFLVSIIEAHADAQQVGGIAAIVNDEVISLYDVNQRIELFLMTSDIEKTQQTIQQLQDQVLRSLIDEMIQLQATKEEDIAIEQEEIDASIQQIAQNFGDNPEALTASLNQNNIKLKTLETQIVAELAWSQFVQYKFGRRISISQVEVEESYNEALAAINQSRYNLSEILLLVDNPAEEEKTLAVANKIIAQLKKDRNFGIAARQFSNAHSAGQEGRIGWVTTSQLNPEIETAVKNLKEGDITQPIKTRAGIYIIKLNAFQESGGGNHNRHLYDLLVLSFDANHAELDTQLLRITKNFKTCKQIERDAPSFGAISTNRTGVRQLGTFMPAIKNILINLEAGEISSSIRTKDSIDLIVVCDRKDAQGANITQDQIEQNMYQQRVSMMSRRHMRELRRDAIIEYR